MHAKNRSVLLAVLYIEKRSPVWAPLQNKYKIIY